MTVRFARLDPLPHQRRSLLPLRGPDTTRFVQGIVSTNVEGLPPDRAVAAGLLTVKGKLISEVVVLPAGGEDLDLLVPAGEVAEVAELLDKHVIMDEVEVRPPEETSVVVMWTDDGSAASVEVDRARARTFVARHPAPSLLLVGSDAHLEEALAGASEVDEAGWYRHRIATASPGWGHEIRPGFFPPEVGFVHAVDYTKGCYMGQEPLARIHARGQVNRVMVRVAIDRMPTATDLVALTTADRPAAGELTTFVDTDEGPRGLAIVRRELATPGTTLEAPDEGLRVTVLSEPLGDDPGVGSRRR